MANEPIVEPEQIQDPAEVQSTENQPETVSDAPSAPQTDVNARFAALESQLARERERSNTLEQSLKIQERYLASQQTETKPATPAKPDEWSQELDVLDKALEPVFNKRLKSVVDPLMQSFSAQRDENDALKFEMFLQRNNPEVLEDEDSYNKTMQQVQAVQQAARQRGLEVSRVDAFVFNEGLQGTRQKITARKQKLTDAVTQESQRTTAVRAAQATSTSGEPRASAAAGIQAIREKANRGERLTDAERVKMKEYVSNVEL